MLDSPKHYNGTDLMDLLIKHNVDFCSGNIMKYVYRWTEKDGLKDLYKALDYLLALIKHEEREHNRLTTELLQPVGKINTEESN